MVVVVVVVIAAAVAVVVVVVVAISEHKNPLQPNHLKKANPNGTGPKC